MSEPPHPVDVAAWVARVAQDPVAHRQRQAVEITLNAIAMTGERARTFSGDRGLIRSL